MHSPATRTQYIYNVQSNEICLTEFWFFFVLLLQSISISLLGPVKLIMQIIETKSMDIAEKK